jgi:hypothetical protein
MYSERSSGRDDRDSPYGRQRDDRYRPRSRSQSRSREPDRDWASADRRSPPPRRRSFTPDNSNSLPLGRDGGGGAGGQRPRSRRSDSGSPLSRDDRDRIGRSRASSRSRSPRKRPSPSPPAPMDGQRFRRENNYRPAYDSTASRDQGQVTRSWTRPPSWHPRGGYQQASLQRPHDHRPGDPSTAPQQRTPPSNIPTDPPPDSPPVPTGPSVPAGPASWRRAQQFGQRPNYPDYRQNFSYNRGGPPMNHLHRDSPRQPLPQQSGPSPALSPHDTQTQSPPFHRPSIPTGPRAFTRPSATPMKKEYVSPVADLKEKVQLPVVLFPDPDLGGAV